MMKDLGGFKPVLSSLQFSSALAGTSGTSEKTTKKYVLFFYITYIMTNLI